MPLLDRIRGVKEKKNEVVLPDKMDERVECVLGFYNADTALCNAFRGLTQGWDECSAMRDLVIFLNKNEEVAISPAIKGGTKKLSLHMVNKIGRRMQSHNKVKELTEERLRVYKEAGAQDLKNVQSKAHQNYELKERAKRKLDKHRTSEWESEYKAIKTLYEQQNQLLGKILYRCERIPLMEDVLLPQLLAAVNIAYESKLILEPSYGYGDAYLKQEIQKLISSRTPTKADVDGELLKLSNEGKDRKVPTPSAREAQMEALWSNAIDELRAEEADELCDALGVPRGTSRKELQRLQLEDIARDVREQQEKENAEKESSRHRKKKKNIAEYAKEDDRRSFY